MRHLHTEGIILHKKAYGEGHELVFILSKGFGKLKVTARGSRKIKSKFLGHLQTLNICKLHLYKGPHSTLITECEAIHPFKYEKLSDKHTGYALKLSEIINNCILEEEQDENLYNLIINGVKEIQITEKPLLPFLKLSTQIISKLGHFSDFADTCPNCLENLDKNMPSYLSEREEIKCSKCIIKSEIYIEVESKYRNFLSYINAMKDEEHKKLKVSAEEENILNKLSIAFLHSSRQF